MPSGVGDRDLEAVEQRRELQPRTPRGVPSAFEQVEDDALDDIAVSWPSRGRSAGRR
jgi:hypothetical protein